MTQLVPIGAMGAAGRQIVETTPNVLATYRDAQVKEQQTRQNLALGEMRLQDARNSLAEYQYKQRGQNLRTRAWSGDAQARQEYARDYPDMLSADQKQVQDALTRSAPALGPAVDQALSMYSQGAQPEQVFQFLQQNANRTGELDSIYAPAGGFGPDDVAPEQLAQFRQQLAAAMPEKKVNASWQTINGHRVLVNDNDGTVIRDAGVAGRDAGGGPNTSWQTINGRRVLMNDADGSVVRDAGAAGKENDGPAMTVTTPDGTTVTYGAPARAPAMNDAAKTLIAVQTARPSWEQYGNALFDPKVSPVAAGGVGAVLSAAAGVSNQIPLVRSATQWAKTHGVPGAASVASADQIQQLRYMAGTLVLQLGPVFSAATKGAPSNKDLQRVNEAIGLLGTTQDINLARFAYAYITNYMNTLEQVASGVAEDGRLPGRQPPMNPNPRGPRPVVPQPAASGGGGGRPASWNQMTPAQRAAWLRGN